MAHGGAIPRPDPRALPGRRLAVLLLATLALIPALPIAAATPLHARPSLAPHLAGLPGPAAWAVGDQSTKGGFFGWLPNSNITAGRSQWSPDTLAGSAPTGAYVGSTWDGVDGRIVAFGGVTGYGGSSPIYTNSTWTFTQGGWTNLCPGADYVGQCGPSPSARAGALMTYDAADHVVLMTGGWGPSISGGAAAPRDDLWSFSGTTWTNLTGSTPPAGLWDGQMTYDAADGFVLAITDTGATWSYLKGNWTELNTIGNAPARSHPALFFESAQRQAILYGGVGQSGRTLNDTWAFSSGAWSKLNVTQAPSDRRSTSKFPVLPESIPSGYDANLGVGVLFDPGGNGGNSTWIFTNDSWENVTLLLGPSLPRSVGATLTFDPLDGYGLLQEFLTPSSPAATFQLTDPMRVDLGSLSVLIDANQTATWTPQITMGLAPYRTYLMDGPSGCYLQQSDTASPILSCSVASAGTRSVTIGVSDALNRTANTSYTLSANADPTIQVNAARPDPSSVGIPVQFFASAASGTPPYSRFRWVFDDGTNSTAFSPSHAFATAGWHSATVTVTDSLGFPVSTHFEMAVHPGPAASAATNVTETDAGLPIQFSSSVVGGTGAISCTWNFGDGSTATGCEASHSFLRLGVFHPRLWANDSLGAGGEANVTVGIVSPLGLDIAAPATPSVVGEPVLLNAIDVGGIAPYTIQWWFGDGGTATGLNVSHAYGAPGTYTVASAITDAVGARVVSESAISVVASADPSNSTGSVSHRIVPPTGSMTVPGVRTTATPTQDLPWLALEIVVVAALVALWLRHDLAGRVRDPGRVGWVRRILRAARTALGRAPERA